MNYLTALLAFAAVMIVLATLATVVVEGLHKLARKRARDFEEMLSKLYDDAVEPRFKQAGVTSLSTGHDFASQIMKNPAFRETKSGLLCTTAFEELTTRQFVEQLAQTDVGKQLQTKSQTLIKSTLAELSYEFERYGEAATNYFERRASALSVLVAFVLALALNVDAIKLYGTLAQDKTLTEKVITNLDIAKLENAYLDKIKKAGDDEEKKVAVNIEYKEILESVRSETKMLEDLGLPIGHNYFPFCAADHSPTTDRRCKDKLPPVIESTAWIIGPILTWFDGIITALRFRVLATQDGIGWLFSALLSGGLIGLGAPFWFKTYRSIASFVPGIKLPDSLLARQKKTGRVAEGVGGGISPAVPPMVATTASAAPSHVGLAGGVPGAPAPPLPPPVPAPSPAPVPPGIVTQKDSGLSEADLEEAFKKSERHWP